jgi:hypothetical protein
VVGFQASLVDQGVVVLGLKVLEHPWSRLGISDSGELKKMAARSRWVVLKKSRFMDNQIGRVLL